MRRKASEASSVREASVTVFLLQVSVSIAGGIFPAWDETAAAATANDVRIDFRMIYSMLGLPLHYSA